MEKKLLDKAKEVVREKYASIAVSSSSCCGDDRRNPEYSMIGESYGSQDGYVKDADLNLGCGLPVEFAQIKEGDTVVDLGSGAGNDVFIARAETGAEGRLIGVDFTEEMIALARKNAIKLGYDNVEFVQGDIEQMPLEDETADVVVSNCVLNLVPDKKQAYRETYRILKPGAHFSISDVVVEGAIPPDLKEQAELYAGCVTGSIPLNEYLSILEEVGFRDVEVQKKRQIDLPESLLEELLTPSQRERYHEADLGIFSITVFGRK
ncbi:MAG: arsenite methyltransferase [Saprospiraceae bacterium]|nr:arsenite methyltransferase [Saprospiraceae bacterium]